MDGFVLKRGITIIMGSYKPVSGPIMYVVLYVLSTLYDLLSSFDHLLSSFDHLLSAF